MYKLAWIGFALVVSVSLDVLTQACNAKRMCWDAFVDAGVLCSDANAEQVSDEMRPSALREAGNSVHGVCMQSSPVERLLRPCVAAHGLESVPAAIHKIWSWARGNVLLLDKLAFLISYSAQFQGYARLRAGLVSTRKPETLNSTKRWKRWMRPRISWAPGI